MSTVNERAPFAEIKMDGQIRAMAFTGNGEYLATGDKEAVRVWRMTDNSLKQVGSTKAKDVRSIAFSRDCRWIAAGKSWGEMTVWGNEIPKRDAWTLKEIITHDDGHTVTSVDFSPDSTRLVTASGSRAASIWDIEARKMVVGPLEHSYWVVAAKFSPQGDRIATATFLRDSVRLYDSYNGTLLADISAKVTPYYNTGLLWSDESIFILFNNPQPPKGSGDNTIKQINVSTTSVISAREWSVPDGNYPCIVSPNPGKFIVYAVGRIVTFCDTMTGSKHSPIELDQDAHSVAVSPDSRLLAFTSGYIRGDGANMVTITIKNLNTFHGTALRGQ